MKSNIFHNNEHINIISNPDITPEKCKENLKHIHTIITSQYLSSRKNNRVTNTTPMPLIHQNKHYHVCVQNWHSSEPTSQQSCKVTYTQYLDTFAKMSNMHNTHSHTYTHTHTRTSLTVAKHQHSTALLV